MARLYRSEPTRNWWTRSRGYALPQTVKPTSSIILSGSIRGTPEPPCTMKFSGAPLSLEVAHNVSCCRDDILDIILRHRRVERQRNQPFIYFFGSLQTV